MDSKMADRSTELALRAAVATRFVEDQWSGSALPAITKYIEIPNKSPMFDANWVENGYMEQAVDLMMEAPAELPPEKLRELHVSLRLPPARKD